MSVPTIPSDMNQIPKRQPKSTVSQRKRGPEDAITRSVSEQKVVKTQSQSQSTQVQQSQSTQVQQSQSTKVQQSQNQPSIDVSSEKTVSSWWFW